MIALLTPKAIAAVAVALALGGFGGYLKGNASGRAAAQAKWDKDIAQREQAQRAEKDRLETEYEQRIKAAIAARDAQIRRVQADADSARAAVGGLRQQLASGRGRLTKAAPAAVADYADTAADILGECASRYTEVARAADGHAADTAALMRAWPGASFGESIGVGNK